LEGVQVGVQRAVEVLLVEDNPGDIRLIMEGFKEGNISHNINVVNDGEEAVNYLKKIPPFQRRIEPDLVLLDLKLPKKSGFEVLAEIRSEDDLKHVPVIVMTSSESDTDIKNAYFLKANCYITKPSDLDRYSDVIKSIHGFWFTADKMKGKGNYDKETYKGPVNRGQ
jgi:CheY-like chemotaxis protein